MTAFLAQADPGAVATAPLAESLPEPMGLGEVFAPYVGVFFASFLVAFIATPIMRRLAIKNGIVDRPDEARKIHKQPTAYLGGIAIFLGWVVGIFCSFITQAHTGASAVDFPMSIVFGAVAILLTGLFDDIWGISPRVKVGGQLFAAAALASDRVGVELVGQSINTIQRLIAPLPLPEILMELLQTPAPFWLIYVLGTLAIAVFVIGGCNAVNLIDGMDGLAAGTSAISATGFLLIAGLVAIGPNPVAYTDPIRIVMALAILGALLGFLPYNFNPANIFMGDAGSLLLGFLCVSNILLFAYNAEGAALKYTTACLIVFAFPITDTSLAIFRRKMQGKPLMSPDDQHIHHLLKRTGMGVKKAVFTMYAGSLAFAAIGVAMIAWQFRFRYLLMVALVLYGFIVVTAYKYGKRQAEEAQSEASDSTPDEASPA